MLTEESPYQDIALSASSERILRADVSEEIQLVNPDICASEGICLSPELAVLCMGYVQQC